jgi:hypothetical protein
MCHAAAAPIYTPMPKTTPNFTRLDPDRPEIAALMTAMLRAREVVAARSWSTSQDPTSEHWWADVLADPRARIRKQPRGFYGRDDSQLAQRAYYRLADEPSPLIEVSCSKCEWKGAFSRAELLAMYGCSPTRVLLTKLPFPAALHEDACRHPSSVALRRATCFWHSPRSYGLTAAGTGVASRTRT